MPESITPRYGATVADLLARIHGSHSLIHHMTNFVVMSEMANATPALGAWPVMARARKEAVERG